MTAPEPTRIVPSDWIELPPNFIDEVKLGVHAGWSYLRGDLDGELVVYTPEDGSTPRAWYVQRKCILGSPVPVVDRES